MSNQTDNAQPRMVQCVKLHKELAGLKRPPFPNALGQRLYDQVSEEGWKMWLGHSTMLINEYRLDLASKQGVEFLLKECEKFFFGEGSAAPPDYNPSSTE
jgi:Fe-S cluster biosynthesis and repair protein YggX